MIDIDRKLKILGIHIPLCNDSTKERKVAIELAINKIFEDNQLYLERLDWQEFDQINELRDYLVEKYKPNYDLIRELIYKQINKEKIKFL